MFMTLFVPPVKTTTIRLAFHFPIHLSVLENLESFHPNKSMYMIAHNVIHYGSTHSTLQPLLWLLVNTTIFARRCQSFLKAFGTINSTLSIYYY